MSTAAADRIRALVEADPVVLVEIAGAIANEGRMPPDAITRVAQDHAVRLSDADKTRLREAVEQMLMGRDVDAARVGDQLTRLFSDGMPEDVQASPVTFRKTRRGA